MLAFTEIVKFQISGMKIDISSIKPGGFGGLDDQIHNCQSETSYPMMPKLCDLVFIFSPIWTGLFTDLNDWPKGPPPNLAISSQMAKKFVKDINTMG